ncbi:MAG TPA: hemerythrin domain-containing protein, partial [Pseudohaliea sp.]|nr:hemerythrin domain-containing protein [Pseudohaliea sp.]
MDPSQRLVPADVPPAAQAQSGPVAFDPILVPCLAQEHRDMLALVESIRSRLRQGRYGEIPTQLSRLQASLEAHLLNERLRLHGYLEHSLASDPGRLARVRESLGEAGRLALSVKELVERVRQTPTGRANAAELLTRLQALREELGSRFEKEEREIYPL